MNPISGDGPSRRVTEPTRDWSDDVSFGEFALSTSFNDTDTPAEVDAVWRTQRRVALRYLALFLLGTLGVGFAITGLPWTIDASLGGFSPAFILVAVGLYVFFLALAIAASLLANTIEDRMMGSSGLPDDSP